MILMCLVLNSINSKSLLLLRTIIYLLPKVIIHFKALHSLWQSLHYVSFVVAPHSQPHVQVLKVDCVPNQCCSTGRPHWLYSVSMHRSYNGFRIIKLWNYSRLMSTLIWFKSCTLTWPLIIIWDQPATLIKVSILHFCFSCFLNCANDNKSYKTPHVQFYVYFPCLHDGFLMVAFHSSWLCEIPVLSALLPLCLSLSRLTLTMLATNSHVSAFIYLTVIINLLRMPKPPKPTLGIDALTLRPSVSFILKRTFYPSG